MKLTGKCLAAGLTALLLLGLSGCRMPFGPGPEATPGPMEPANARRVSAPAPEWGTSIDNTQKNQ